MSILTDGGHGWDAGTLKPGDVIGDYVVQAKLGQGGMGEVYRAEHPVIKARVAIKVLSRELGSSEEAVNRLRQEAVSVNVIDHPNIVRIFNFGQLPDGRHYIVMEHLDGQNLRTMQTLRGPPPIPEALRILRDVARALDAAHDAGVLHRDIKPDNIFLVRDETREPRSVKLLDFGIAKLSAELGPGHRTQTAVIMGSPDYMSPEQCHSLPLDRRADLYSLGVVAYELMTGQLPFRGETTFETMMQHVTKPPQPPSKRSERVPEALDAPLLRVLAKKADDRFPRAMALVEALEAAWRRAVADGTAEAETVAGWPAVEGQAIDAGSVFGWRTPVGRPIDRVRDSGSWVASASKHGIQGIPVDERIGAGGTTAAWPEPGAAGAAAFGQHGAGSTAGAPTRKGGGSAGRGESAGWGWDDDLAPPEAGSAGLEPGSARESAKASPAAPWEAASSGGPVEADPPTLSRQTAARAAPGSGATRAAAASEGTTTRASTPAEHPTARTSTSAEHATARASASPEHATIRTPGGADGVTIHATTSAEGGTARAAEARAGAQVPGRAAGSSAGSGLSLAILPPEPTLPGRSRSDLSSQSRSSSPASSHRSPDPPASTGSAAGWLAGLVAVVAWIGAIAALELGVVWALRNGYAEGIPEPLQSLIVGLSPASRRIALGVISLIPARIAHNWAADALRPRNKHMIDARCRSCGWRGKVSAVSTIKPVCPRCMQVVERGGSRR